MIKQLHVHLRKCVIGLSQNKSSTLNYFEVEWQFDIGTTHVSYIRSLHEVFLWQPRNPPIFMFPCPV